MFDLRIVIPAFNEELSIGQVIDGVKKACPEAEIVIVDDKSTDSTAKIAENSDVKLIKNNIRMGYGRALKEGFTKTLDGKREPQYFAFLDADGTYPPESIPLLYALCKEKGYQIAVGSRISGKNRGMPLIRLIGNRFFANLTTFYT